MIAKAYDFVLWLLPKVESFPKSYRFTVGDRLTSNGLDMLTSIVNAAYSQKKESQLRDASDHVNAIRYLLRLSKDLKLMSVDSYGFSAERLDEIGRMLGGWRKSLPARS